MRAQVVLVDNDRILLAQHRRGDDVYWVLPGGAVEAGETPEEAAIREMREETGLEVCVERLLFVDGPRDDGRVSIKSPRYTYLARIEGGRLQRCEAIGGNEENGYLECASWMPFESDLYDAQTRDTLALVLGAMAGTRDEIGFVS